MVGEATGAGFCHRQGQKHGNADALSRTPCKQCGRSEDTHTQEELIATTAVEPQQIDQSNRVREAQLADPELGPLLRGKQHAKKPDMEEMKSMSRSSNRLAQIWDQLVVRNGVLFRKFLPPVSTRGVLQKVVPRVLSDLHAGTMGGHLGVDKTLSRLKERFYWPGHYNDVQEWCRVQGEN